MIFVKSVARQEMAIFWAHRYPIVNQFFYLKAWFLGFILITSLILKTVCQLILLALNKREFVDIFIVSQTNPKQNTTDCCSHTRQRKTIYITLEMILSDLVCFCSLDTGQENYDFWDFSFIVTSGRRDRTSDHLSARRHVLPLIAR